MADRALADSSFSRGDDGELASSQKFRHTARVWIPFLFHFVRRLKTESLAVAIHLFHDISTRTWLHQDELCSLLPAPFPRGQNHPTMSQHIPAWFGGCSYQLHSSVLHGHSVQLQRACRSLVAAA